MNYTLRQIRCSFESLDCKGDKDAVLEQLSCSIEAAQCALVDMNMIQVQGRQNVDTLLGCMLAIEAIIGDKDNG